MYSWVNLISHKAVIVCKGLLLAISNNMASTSARTVAPLYQPASLTGQVVLITGELGLLQAGAS